MPSMGGVTTNAPIINELALALRGFGGAVVMVTNPVDLMSRLLAEVSGIPRVVGIGSKTSPTARLSPLRSTAAASPISPTG